MDDQDTVSWEDGNGNDSTAAVATYAVDPTESLCAAIPLVVADVTGDDTTTLPLLYDRIDPDALDTIFGSHIDDPPRPTCRIDFSYCGLTVTVQGNGQFTVTVSSDTQPATDPSHQHG